MKGVKIYSLYQNLIYFLAPVVDSGDRDSVMFHLSSVDLAFVPRVWGIDCFHDDLE